MKLDPRSIPYRAAERALRLFWPLAFVGISSMSVGGFGPLAVGGLSIVGFVLLLAWETAVYRRFEYEVTADTVDIRSGVFSRRDREIPIRRIQNVDTSRNVVQRLLGITEVRLETAGGGSTEASLRYVSPEAANRFRERLRRRGRAVGEADAEPGDATIEEPTVLFAIKPRELLLLGLVSIDLRLVSLAIVSLPIVAPSLARRLMVERPAVGPAGAIVVAPIAAIGLILLSGFVSGALSVSNYYGFRLLRAGEDLRYERGLLQRNEGTIPVEKVQAIALEENVLARTLGYATLAVETAGYAPGQGPSGGSEAAVPLAERERCLSLARSIEPVGEVPAFERPPKRARTRYAVRYTLLVCALAAVVWGLTRVTALPLVPYAPLALLPAVPVAAHLKWANRGYTVAEGYVLTRNGFWTRTTTIVPYYRVQTVIQSETVFQRRRHLASVVVDTAGAGGSRAARAVDIDDQDANEFRETVADRLQRALAARRSRKRAASASGPNAFDRTGSDGDEEEIADATDAADPTIGTNATDGRDAIGGERDRDATGLADTSRDDGSDGDTRGDSPDVDTDEDDEDDGRPLEEPDDWNRPE